MARTHRATSQPCRRLRRCSPLSSGHRTVLGHRRAERGRLQRSRCRLAGEHRSTPVPSRTGTSAGGLGGTGLLSDAADGDRAPAGRRLAFCFGVASVGRRYTGHAGARGRSQAWSLRTEHALAGPLCRRQAGRSPRGDGRRAHALAGVRRAQRDLRSSRGAGAGPRRFTHAGLDEACLRRWRGTVPSCPARQRRGHRLVQTPGLRQSPRARRAVAPAKVIDANRDGWHVVWTAFVVAVFGWGVGFYGPGVYLAALHQRHGWPISTISMAITAHYLVSAILITWLPDAYRRFGVARVTMVGAAFAATGAIAWTNVQLAWQLVPALMLSGIGWAAMSGAALNAIEAPWIERGRPPAISTVFN